MKYNEEEVWQLEKDMKNPFLTVKVPVNRAWEMKTKRTWEARSFYQQEDSNGDCTYWHLHGELIDNDGTAMICSSCCNALKQKGGGA